MAWVPQILPEKLGQTCASDCARLLPGSAKTPSWIAVPGHSISRGEIRALLWREAKGAAGEDDFGF